MYYLWWCATLLLSKLAQSWASTFLLFHLVDFHSAADFHICPFALCLGIVRSARIITCDNFLWKRWSVIDHSYVWYLVVQISRS
jgi:hypothetical protein